MVYEMVYERMKVFVDNLYKDVSRAILLGLSSRQLSFHKTQEEQCHSHWSVYVHRFFLPERIKIVDLCVTNPRMT